MTDTKCWQGYETSGAFIHCFWKWNNQEISQKAKHTFTMGTSHSTPTYFPKRNESVYLYVNTYTQMFIVVLLVIEKIGSNPKCLSIAEWITKLQYIRIMKSYTAVERNEVLIGKNNDDSRWLCSVMEAKQKQCI